MAFHVPHLRFPRSPTWSALSKIFYSAVVAWGLLYTGFAYWFDAPWWLFR